MLYDFIIADKNVKKPLYQQIYLSVRKAIENGSLKVGSKLPSIRKLSADMDISKTTVTTAYEQLCVEGYIINKPQSGYYVAADFEHIKKAADSMEQTVHTGRYYEFDFSGKSIDNQIIDIAQWKKNIRDVINRNYLMTSYGDAQGEPALRMALQKYALGIRSVNAHTGNIVVGAGTQSILLLLCALLGAGKRVAMERSSFIQAEFVFKSFGNEIAYFDCDAYGVKINSLKEISPDIVVINPNFSGKRGTNMPINRRLELIDWARRHNALIIEDDYNGELRYSTRPIPCVQNYDTENTVYIGSFSKVLLPSVRISYMVLPDKLLQQYHHIKRLTNQTASKTEQLALAKYIDNGKIDAHLRRARRIYLEKSKQMLKSVKRNFAQSDIVFNETSLYVKIIPDFQFDREKLEQALDNSSVNIMSYGKDENAVTLSFSGIEQNKIDEGIALVKRCVEAART